MSAEKLIAAKLRIGARMHYLEIAVLVFFLIISINDVFKIRRHYSRGGSVENVSFAFHLLGWVSIAIVFFIPLNYLHLLWLFPFSLFLAFILCMAPLSSILISTIWPLFTVGINHNKLLARRTMTTEMNRMFIEISGRSGDDLATSVEFASKAELRWIELNDEELQNLHSAYTSAIEMLEEDPDLIGDEALQKAFEKHKSN